MGSKRKALAISVRVFLTFQFLFLSQAAADEGSMGAVTAERLERLLREQRQELELLKRQVDQLRQTVQQAQSEAKEAKAQVERMKASAQRPVEKVPPLDQPRIKLAISGQVNRAMNVADDGKDTEAYFVDNDASNSRVRFIGTARATEDLTIGSRIELAIVPNKASEVDQENQESGDTFDQRWTEVSLDSKRFGRLSLGKGDTASNTSAELDLSRTDVVQYATVADIAAGLRFQQESGDSLTNVRVSDAFKSLDGLSRRNRVRYDTPTFHGLRLAGSLVSDQRYDASLWWGGQGFGFKSVGAVAIANPNENDTGYQYDGSFSLLHEATGLNLTLSAGLKEREGQDDQYNLWGKVGWLTRFFSFGQTAFGSDYGRSIHFPSENDEGFTVGGAVVQQFEDYGTELYLQYRLYSLDRDADPDVHDITVGTIGARVKF